MLNSERTQAAALLRKAATIMRRGGFANGTRGPVGVEDAPHCALGALDCARNKVWSKNGEGEPEWHRLAYQTLAKIVRPQIPKGTIDRANTSQPIEEREAIVSSVVACWNNVVAKSAEKVAACMNAAAEILDIEAEAAEAETVQGKET